MIEEDVLRVIHEERDAVFSKIIEWHDNGKWMRTQLTATIVACGRL